MIYDIKLVYKNNLNYTIYNKCYIKNFFNVTFYF